MTDGTRVLSAILRDAAARLNAADIYDGMADARILVCAVAGLSREDLLREPNRELSPTQYDAFSEVIRRRCDREPVSRILGCREFRSLEFLLGPDTLDPRADSETIVEAAIDYGMRIDGAVRVLDLGTGTGCLLLAILNDLPHADGIGVDISDGAIRIAVRNATALGLSERAEFVRSDWTDGVDQVFELVVANPPYIESAEILGLMPEVARYDPVRALDGGADGLQAYRNISARLGAVLAPGGVAIFEIGPTQRDAVAEIFDHADFELVEVRRDLGDRPRALVFRRPEG